MIGAVCYGLSIAVGVASGALAWSHVRRVRRVLGKGAEALAIALKRLPADERLDALLEKSEPGSFEHDLARQALGATGEDARVAAVNDVLAEVDHAIAIGARWPATGLRIALFGAAFCAFVAFIADPFTLRFILPIVLIGGVAAAVCAHAGRTGARLAQEQRRVIDALVAAALALPAEASGRGAPPPDPGRRRRRGTR